MWELTTVEREASRANEKFADQGHLTKAIPLFAAN
jgi:hypothetical protein